MNRFRYAATALFLALAASAFAVRPDGPAAGEDPKQREAAPLLYLLPSLGTHGNVAMEIRILQGKRQLVREAVALPADVADGAAVDVLFTHPAELTRLRTLETATPGSLRFIALVQGRVVTDEPFAAIEAGGAKLSPEAAVGEIREVEVRAVRKPLVRALGKDPDCTYWCDVQQNSCLEWCDPRGDSCNQCYTWYNDCWSQCGDVCSDATTTYTTYTPTSTTNLGWRCVANSYPAPIGKRWDRVTVTYVVTNYQRTQHCDGNYTDTPTGSYNTTMTCWKRTNINCGPSDMLPDSNICP
ncbi:MAG TPA: hypothetical protein VGR02_12555 [Thermoanaerobaculia bacterium]|jgi:hypothetical protein|nr:hypothetical protein [Thermoanaerobaculia bacterium]